ncbi:helix-turn-helix transcriptional regulator [Vibrio crassostreae]|uniref:helix-turn-helix transcriptional regulator n=1 Tax=Vibrio crassostreae TaxID=246167 RepID=UPI00104F86BD|nr:AlpA family phage regulatory protein [Vibrio crassostreae]TCT63250.1 AlpA family transcriptional regulator [Vibrio crassostreae]
MKSKEPHIYRIHDLIKITGLSRSSIYDKINQHSPRHDASFPRSLSLGPRAVGWLSSEVHEWLDSKARARQSDDEGGIQ